jgi:hypothetical protein
LFSTIMILLSNKKKSTQVSYPVLIVVPTLPDVKKQYLIKGDMCKSSRKMVNNKA